MFSFSKRFVTLNCAFLLVLSVPTEANTISCPNDPHIEGYSTWEGLKQADLDAGGKFILCPGTTLNATSGRIKLEGSFVTIQCGPNGHRGEKCVIEGGRRQFDVFGDGAKFRGIQFRNSESAVSVGANIHEGPIRESVFLDCVFEGNDSTLSGFLGAAANVYFGSIVRFQRVSFFENISFCCSLASAGSMSGLAARIASLSATHVPT